MKKKYEVLGIVGEGAYGIVYKCKNKETGKFVAIKKFKETDDELVQKTMKRELKMLQIIKHPNVVEFQEAFSNKGNLFLVFEYVEKNLLEVLEESPDGLSPKLIKSFVYQMCKAIAYLHSINMIHRDVKPENLLIDENLQLKICDFGFARKVKLNNSDNNINEMTDYVATRWYRSPELLLSGGIYGPSVDYWAVGCIMGELADGNPMFPGDNETDQINCIIKVLGDLPNDLVDMFYKNSIYKGKELLKVSRPETIERKYMGKLGPTAIDFMKGLLQLDPKKRLNSETVFKHKYFACFMKEEEEKKQKEKEEKEKLEKEKQIKSSKSTIYNNTISMIKVNSKDELKDISSKNSPQKSKDLTLKDNNKSNNINNDINFLSSTSFGKTKMLIKGNSKKNIKEYKKTNKISKIDIKDNTHNNFYNMKETQYNKFPNNNIVNVNVNFNGNLYNNSFNISNGSLLNITSRHFNNMNIKQAKKSLSMSKCLKFSNLQNTTLSNNFPSLMNISLSQGKLVNIKNSYFNNNNNNNNYMSQNYNNISSTIYNSNSFNNKKNQKSNNNNINIYNNTFLKVKNGTNKNSPNRNSQNNIMSLLPNGYLGSYNTFLNKNDSRNKNGPKGLYSNYNNKYDYNINTNYINDELKNYNNNNKNGSTNKYKNNMNSPSYYNIIDENDEYENNNSSILDNNKSLHRKNVSDGKKLNNKMLSKYGGSFINSNNKYYNNKNKNNKIKTQNKGGYGTMYNYGGGFEKNKAGCQLPQLFREQNNSDLQKSHYMNYFGIGKNKYH